MKRIAYLFVLAACGSPAARSTTSAPPPAPAPVTAPAPPEHPTYANVPTTRVGAQLAWVFDRLARGGQITDAEVTARFHESFLAQVPPSQLVPTFAEMAKKMPGLVVTKTSGDDNRLLAHVTTGSVKLRVSIVLDAASGRITGLLFQPDPGEAPRPKSYDEAKEMLSKLAPRVQLLVAEAGTCKPVTALSPDERLAIGSTGKLYILLGLVDRILAGKASWDQELAVRDDWKSLPTGTTQNDPAGTKLSLQTFAERMISISDNTATDHLLYTVGRREVEAAVRATKHGKPALNAPFLSTRELFLFKLGMPAEEVDAYVAMPEAKRRAYLDKTLVGKVPTLEGAAEWTTARRIDKLEWFASSNDLCRAMSTLKARAAKPKAAPLLDVLSKNPGLPISKEQFPYIGFKGGAEPGVYNLTYLLRRSDDKWFVFTFSANTDEGGALDQEKLIAIANGTIDVLGSEAAPAQGEAPADGAPATSPAR